MISRDERVAMRSALTKCAESSEFIQAVLEEAETCVVLYLDGTWLIRPRARVDEMDEALIVEIPALSEEARQEIEAEFGRVSVETIMNSDYFMALGEALYENFLKVSPEPEEKKLSLHWFAVGYVSPKAEQWIKECGGQIRQVSDEPRVVLAAIAYDPDGSWYWSHGERQFSRGVEYWSSGELQEKSTGINLQYRSIDSRNMAEYESVETRFLILPDEEYSTEIGGVKPEEEEGEVPAQHDQMDFLNIEGDLSADLDTHPF